MKLDSQSISDFQKAFEQDFPGQQISPDEAEALGNRLIGLFSIIYKPIPKNEHDLQSNS